MQYPNTSSKITDDTLNSLYEVIEQSDDLVREWLLNFCHDYGMEMINILIKNQLQVAHAMTLESIEEYNSNKQQK
jgi:hypothetical protein